MTIKDNLNSIKDSLPIGVSLIAVSKTKPIELIEECYLSGQRDFGENKVQELANKFELLPKDIKWHMIGHLQSNKVKFIAPFVHLIHGVDSFKLLKEINKRAIQNKRIINCLLQVHIAKETTKFGFSMDEIIETFNSQEFKLLQNVNIVGLMGMATNTKNEVQITEEFLSLKSLYDQLIANNFRLTTLSMGMSGDYKIAIEAGSNMIRVGSAIFGARNYSPL